MNGWARKIDNGRMGASSPVLLLCPLTTKGSSPSTTGLFIMTIISNSQCMSRNHNSSTKPIKLRIKQRYNEEATNSNVPKRRCEKQEKRWIPVNVCIYLKSQRWLGGKWIKVAGRQREPGKSQKKPTFTDTILCLK